MSTFNRFSEVHQLMQEVDLLLVSLFRNMCVTRYTSYWHADRAAY